MTTGRVLVGEKHIFLALYPEHHNLHIGLPPELENRFDRCANIIYKSRTQGSKTDKDKGIDLFLLKNNNDFQFVISVLDYRLKSRQGWRNLYVESLPDLVRKGGLDKEINQKELDTRFGIRYHIKKDFKDLTERILESVRADIYQFFLRREEPLKQDNETYVKVLDEILRPTIMKKLKGNVRIKVGTKAQVHEFCYQDLSVDFTRGCKSYEYTVQTTNGKVNIFNHWLGCDYCYNRWVNKHHFSYGYHVADKKDLGEQIEELEKTVFKDRKILVLRVGAGTECFNPELMPHVMTTIEAANEKGISVVWATKTPFFDKYVADFLSKHKANLMISLGTDKLEKGVCRQGFSNKERIELAKKYNEYNSGTFKVVLYPLTDFTTHPAKQKFWSAREAYRLNQLNQEKNMLIQFLLYRTNSLSLLEELTDRPIITEPVEAQRELLSLEDNGYYLSRCRKENFYMPLRYHDFFIDIIEHEDEHSTRSICSVLPYYSACGACHVPGLERRKGPQEKKRLPDYEERKQEKAKRATKIKQKQTLDKHRFQKQLLKK